MSHRRARAGLAAVLAACLVAACSSGDDDAAPRSSPATATAAGSPATASAASEAPVPEETSAPASTSPPVASSTAVPTTRQPATTAPPAAGAAGPAGDAFWVPPDPLPPGEPGDVIWRRPVDTDLGAAELILYRSTDVRGDAVAVSAVVYAPDQPRARGGDLPVLALAHGTTGIADECAPTRLVASGRGWDLTAVPALLEQGWVVVATDYEGLGTPGTHTYLVSDAEARAVLDAARAAQRLGVGAGPGSPVVLFGHSQGGGASAAAAHLAPAYAPELDVRGAVAGAPATEVADLGGVELSGPLIGFGMMIVAGYAAAYPDLDVGAMLTRAGEAQLGRVEDGCVTDVLAGFAGSDSTGWARPVDTPGREAWAAAFAANTPGADPTGVPVYVFHGDADNIVPPTWSAAYQARACAAGSNVTRVVLAGKDHLSVISEPPAVDDALAWAQARLAGEPAPPGCPAP